MVQSIVVVSNGWFPNLPGGLNRYVYELTDHLTENQELVDVELCGIDMPQDIDSSLKLTNLAEVNQPLLKRMWLTRKNFVRRKIAQPSAINLHFSLYALPIIFSLPKDVPVTFTFHGPWALESERENANSLSIFAKKWIEKQVYNRCDRFIVLSKAFGNILHEEYGVDWEKINIIPGGVDTERFKFSLSRQQARQRLDWGQDRTILFTPRRLVHRMGIDKLLEAIALIKEQVPDVWLAIAGKGPLRETLEQKSTLLELQDHVQFLGFLPDELLPIAYQAADLTVVPSQALEGFGLILLESLACGTPVLCTPVGGMPEVLNPFCPELVTTGIETEMIAERLQNLLTEKRLLPSREDCRDYAVTHFNWKDIAQQVLDVLLLEKTKR